MAPATFKHIESGAPIIFCWSFAAGASSLYDSMVSFGTTVIAVDAFNGIAL
jgi:hypothetical protein